MSEQTITIGANGKVSPDFCRLSKASDVLFADNHESLDYELRFDINGSPFEYDSYTVPAGKMHYRIGAPVNGHVNHFYDYHSRAKRSKGEAADPTIIITG